MISLIRLTPPRHAVRRVKQNIMRRRATKVIAAPLVTAAVVATESVVVSTPPTGLAAHHDGELDASPSAPPTTVAPPTT
ncbi:MAG TPA: hypothetical protein VLZ77_07840, partial [Acidimicrobiales bacterium]|nr:hypothetical protein [Acidimicrobiales bacterium]